MLISCEFHLLRLQNERVHAFMLDADVFVRVTTMLNALFS